jgi:hypothetical protein
LRHAWSKPEIKSVLPQLVNAISIYQGDKKDSASTIFKALNPHKTPRPWTLVPVAGQPSSYLQATMALPPTPLVHIPEFVPHQEAIIQVIGDNPTIDMGQIKFQPISNVPNIMPILEKFALLSNQLEVEPEIAPDTVYLDMPQSLTDLTAPTNESSLVEDLALSEDESTITNNSADTSDTEIEEVVIIHEAGTQTDDYSVPIPESFLAPNMKEVVDNSPPIPDVLVPSQQVLDNHLLTVWSNIHKFWDTMAIHNPKLAADWALDTESLLRNMSQNI